MIPVCPKCHVPLFLVVEEEIEVDYCPKCRGVWLDAGELETLATRAGMDTRLLRAALDPTTAKREKSKSLCPRCDQWLLEFTPDASGPSPDHKDTFETPVGAVANRDRSSLAAVPPEKKFEESREMQGRQVDGDANKLRLERCPRGHGFWFDAGELEQLLLSVADGTTAHAVPVFFSKIFGAPRP